MFEKITPEQAGVKTENIIKYINSLEKVATTHGLLMMRNGKIFHENYWKPFNQDFCHRMYSQTKSFVGIAIVMLAERGKLNINDCIVDYFPEKINGELSENLKKLTIRNMLTMNTAGQAGNWFTDNAFDRTSYYFETNEADHVPGTTWGYDSAGSQVLSALVEKLSGTTLLDFLKTNLFDKMGTFKTAEMLQTPNGDSWGDSAMLCTLRDMASFAQLLANGGKWNGEELISEYWVNQAISKQVDNHEKLTNEVFREGYGYQIWRTAQNGFAFVGMGDQLTICLPDRGFIFTITSDNQIANPVARSLVVNNLFNFIIDDIVDVELPTNVEANGKLKALCDGLKLRFVKGQEDSPLRGKISGRTFVCEPNRMGFKWFKFVFEDATKGALVYENEQGEKRIDFGVNHNVFGNFPQYGYNNQRGVVPTTDGFTFKDAVSFAWLSDNKIGVLVQIIDRYFGACSMIYSFNGEDVALHFEKSAEYFLNEYFGKANAKLVK